MKPSFATVTKPNFCIKKSLLKTVALNMLSTIKESKYFVDKQEGFLKYLNLKVQGFFFLKEFLLKVYEQ